MEGEDPAHLTQLFSLNLFLTGGVSDPIVSHWLALCSQEEIFLSGY